MAALVNVITLEARSATTAVTHTRLQDCGECVDVQTGSLEIPTGGFTLEPIEHGGRGWSHREQAWQVRANEVAALVNVFTLEPRSATTGVTHTRLFTQGCGGWAKRERVALECAFQSARTARA